MNFSDFLKAIETLSNEGVPLGAAALLVFMFIIFIAIIVISMFGYYKMFKKAGEAGWKAFIPYYNNYICFKFAWNTKPFWFYLAAILIFQSLSGLESLLLSLIGTVFGIVFIVMGIKLDIRVAKSFGKSTAWGVLLFFFPFIVSLILGFGKAEYIGNTTLE